VLGKGFSTAACIGTIFILLAHQNSQYMLGTRILYALSCDGLGSEKATSVSDKGTPTGSLFFSWLLTMGLITAGGLHGIHGPALIALHVGPDHRFHTCISLVEIEAVSGRGC